MPAHSPLPPLVRRLHTPWRWFTLALAVHVALAAWFVLGPAAGGAAWQGFPLDDSWIHLVYGRSVAEQGLPYYNERPEAGFSSLLWMLVLAVAHVVASVSGLGVVTVAKACGVLAAAVTTASIGQLAWRLGGSVAVGLLALALCAANPVLAFAQVSGMEVAVTTACLARAVLAVTERRWRTAGVWLAGACLGRPECVLLVAWFALAPFAQQGQPMHTRVRAAFAAGWPTLAAAVVWAGYCLWATGHPLPNTFYAKFQLDTDAPVWRPFTEMLFAQPMNALGLGLVALAVAPFVVRRPRAWLVALLATAPLLFVVAIARTRPCPNESSQYFFFARYPAPAWPLAAAAAAIGLGGLVRRVARRLPVGAGRLGGGAFAATLLLVALLHTGPLASAARRYADNCQNIHEVQVAFGNWAREHLPADAVLAVNDAGAIRYVAPQRSVDLLGLNSADVLFGRPSLGEVAADADRMADWLLARGVATMIVFPTLFPAVVEHPRFGVRFTELQRFTSGHYTIADPRSGQATMVAYRVLPRTDAVPSPVR